MELPQALDGELASLSTDLGDLWSAQKVLAERVESFLKSPHDWETAGDYLVDIRASIEHIAWHVRSVRRPLNKITRFAYKKVAERQESSDGQ